MELRRVGELSAALKTTQGACTELRRNDAKKLKREALTAAGLAQVRAGMTWYFRRGLWADAEPEPPWEWRSTKREK